MQGMRWTHALWGAGLSVTTTIAAAQTCAAPRHISGGELLDAMQQHGNYDIVAVPNWGRFQTEVFLNLMRASLARDSAGEVIRIEAEDWFQDYLSVARLDSATAPYGTRRAHELGQWMQLDFRRNTVVRSVRRGQSPSLAANVRIAWPGGPAAPSKFTYRDTVSEPHAKITSAQLITYHLLSFGDDRRGTVLYDDIEGVSGRATTGVLAFLLRVFGERPLSRSRMTAGGGDTLVTRLDLRHTFGISKTLIVVPEGRAEALPSGRRDLDSIDQALRQPLEIQYAPYSC